MTDTWKIFPLPDSYAPAPGDDLQQFLRDNATSPIRIDASQLRRLDTMSVEVLLSAARSWREKGLGFELVQLSRPNEEVCLTLGLRSEHLIWRVAA
jgi:anti-anti-sigma regulatory factor